MRRIEEKDKCLVGMYAILGYRRKTFKLITTLKGSEPYYLLLAGRSPEADFKELSRTALEALKL